MKPRPKEIPAWLAEGLDSLPGFGALAGAAYHARKEDHWHWVLERRTEQIVRARCLMCHELFSFFAAQLPPEVRPPGTC